MSDDPVSVDVHFFILVRVGHRDDKMLAIFAGGALAGGILERFDAQVEALETTRDEAQGRLERYRQNRQALAEETEQLDADLTRAARDMKVNPIAMKPLLKACETGHKVKVNLSSIANAFSDVRFDVYQLYGQTRSQRRERDARRADLMAPVGFGMHSVATMAPGLFQDLDSVLVGMPPQPTGPQGTWKIVRSNERTGTVVWQGSRRGDKTWVRLPATMEIRRLAGKVGFTFSDGAARFEATADIPDAWLQLCSGQLLGRFLENLKNIDEVERSLQRANGEVNKYEAQIQEVRETERAYISLRLTKIARYFRKAEFRKGIELEQEKAAVVRLQDALAREREEHERALDRMREELERQSAEMREEYDRRLAETGEEHERRLAETGEEHERQLAEMREDSAQMREEHERQLVEMREDSAQMREEHERQLAETGEEHERQLAEMREDVAQMRQARDRAIGVPDSAAAYRERYGDIRKRSCISCFSDDEYFGVDCGNDHFVCSDCLDIYVNTTVESPGTFADQGLQIVCPMQGCGRPFELAKVAREISDRGIRRLTDALGTAKVSELESKRLVIFKAAEDAYKRDPGRYDGRGGIWTAIAVESVRETILTPRCPVCSAPWVDFDGCAVLTCGNCSSNFCALCSEDLRSSPHERDPHRHFWDDECPLASTTVYVSQEVVRNRRRILIQRKIQELIAPLSPSVRSSVLKELAKDLIELDMAVQLVYMLAADSNEDVPIGMLSLVFDVKSLSPLLVELGQRHPELVPKIADSHLRSPYGWTATYEGPNREAKWDELEERLRFDPWSGAIRQAAARLKGE